MEKNSANPMMKQSKAFSCIRCFERKVKCDKNHPCSGCVRAKVECVLRIPAAPRRRQKTIADEDTLARLKHYEDLLRENNIDFETSHKTSLMTNPSSTTEFEKYATKSTSAHADSGAVSKGFEPPDYDPKLYPPPVGNAQGKLIGDHGRSRFIENKLWTSVSEEFHHSQDAISESESEDEMDAPVDDSIEFVLGMTPSTTHISELHPNPDHILKLWKIFLSNVNPMMKIIHHPTLQQSIKECTTNMEKISRGTEALLFAIYAAAILSMRDGECLATFGESRSVLQYRYGLGTRRSLTRARFMGTSDLTVLQAFVIYLLTMRQETDSRTLWTLSGVAYRIAQGMGLHRDGTILGLSPFQTEMRRRLWWQISLLDFRAAEMSGFGALGDVNWWNTKSPANVNDSELWPDMKEPPEEQTQPTEMIACMIRYESGVYVRQKILKLQGNDMDFTRSAQKWVATAPISEKDAFIDELDEHIHEKFVKRCNITIPEQMLATIIGPTICNTVRIVAHHPRRYPSEKDIPEKERVLLWKTSMALLEADNNAHSYPSLQKFQWHIDLYFPWQALIYVLSDLISRPTGEGKDDAWPQIEAIFKNHPTFITNYKKPLHMAIGSKCMRAWKAREKAQIENPQGSSWLETPSFILQLQSHKEDIDAKASLKSAELSQSMSKGHLQSMNQMMDSSWSNLSNVSTNQLPSADMFESPSASDLSGPMIDDMVMDWQKWDSLLNDFDMSFMGTNVNSTQLQHVEQYEQQIQP